MDSHEKSFEPMDIDTSSHSNPAMDISYNNSGHDLIKTKTENVSDTVHCPPGPPAEQIAAACTPTEITPQPTAIKKYHILLPKQNKSSFQINVTMKIVLTALAVVFAMITYQCLNITCSDNLNIDMLHSSLTNNLFGQYKAIDMIVEGLRANERTKILFLYGGTGVGKTYTTSQILNQVGYHSNIYHYTMPNFADSFSTDFMVGLTMCSQSIVIVDDLKLESDIFNHINNLVTKSEDLDKNVTIILVYSCKTTEDKKECDLSFPKQLLELFKSISTYKKLIKFETLKRQHLQKCIEHELQREISDIEFLKFLRTFNVTIDGCKGVHHKVKHLSVY